MQIVEPSFYTRLMISSDTPSGAWSTSPSGVAHVGPRGSRAAGEVVDLALPGSSIPLPARNVARRPRCHSSRPKAGRSTAAIVSRLTGQTNAFLRDAYLPDCAPMNVSAPVECQSITVVTRNASSSVVTPSRTLRMASSRRVMAPCSMAYCCRFGRDKIRQSPVERDEFVHADAIVVSRSKTP